MKKKSDKTDDTEERKMVWVFFIIGIVLLLAGIFIHIPTESVSLPKAESLAGAFLMIAAVVALIITA